MKPETIAKTYVIRGHVQGVGYRYFVDRCAKYIGLAGHVRNLDTGDVEVYAIGTAAQLAELAGRLWQGPRMSEVRGVEEREAVVHGTGGFKIHR